MFTNYDFSKEFEFNVVDSFIEVLSLYDCATLKEHVRDIMKQEDPDKDPYRCLCTVISALDEVRTGEDGTSAFMSAKTIERHLLSFPVEMYIKTFDKYAKEYGTLLAEDEVPDGLVSPYHTPYEIMNYLSGSFCDLEQYLREELKKTVGDAFGVRVPEADINPEDVQIIFKSEDLPEPFNKEDLQNIETEDPELEFTPIY